LQHSSKDKHQNSTLSSRAGFSLSQRYTLSHSNDTIYAGKLCEVWIFFFPILFLFFKTEQTEEQPHPVSQLSLEQTG